jgi:hypothetical protein
MGTHPPGTVSSAFIATRVVTRISLSLIVIIPPVSKRGVGRKERKVLIMCIGRYLSEFWEPDCGV